MTVITRFAPSPTGDLHIGSARTALFNWLFARHFNGTFCLRIEDTDHLRSSNLSMNSIIDSLRWLELDWDGEIVLQSSRINRHVEIAEFLLSRDKAYYCYCTPTELEEMRKNALLEGRSPKYDMRCRNLERKKHKFTTSPVIRFKVPNDREIIIKDLVHGELKINNDQLDDMVLIRSDNTPTYMLSVVVDDHDMGITHIIRGVDHLTNTFRQYHLYKALKWNIPNFAHIPLIHDQNGTKLSKRNNVISIEYYKNNGYLPEAIRNYLLRLGWSHGNKEIISTKDAINLFNLKSIGKSSSRFDLNKLNYLNSHYLRNSDNLYLLNLISIHLEKNGIIIDENHKNRILLGLDSLKKRSSNFIDLVDNLNFYIKSPSFKDLHDRELLRELFSDSKNLSIIGKIREILNNFLDFNTESLEYLLKNNNKLDITLAHFSQILRIALTGKRVSPSIFEIMSILGKEETISRIKNLEVHIKNYTNY